MKDYFRRDSDVFVGYGHFMYPMGPSECIVNIFHLYNDIMSFFYIDQ